MIDQAEIGIVAIGRNEGDRLRRCLQSLPASASVVYVDSGSTDSSVPLAKAFGAEIVELSLEIPFTAARARNAGFKRLQEFTDRVRYIQFIDGDCELSPGWIEAGAKFLDQEREVGAVCGRLIEKRPDQSIYNWMCQREWDRPLGQSTEIGGIALFRDCALRQVGGYRDDMIAGEEPELCVRLRASGWRVWRLGEQMATHDAAITSFQQWWKRAVRSGYAFAQGADLHGGSPERHYVWECRRSWLWAVVIPILCLAFGIAFSPWGWLAFLVFPAQIARQALRTPGSLKERLTISAFQMVARFAETWGQIRYWRSRLLGREGRLIEYK